MKTPTLHISVVAFYVLSSFVLVVMVVVFLAYAIIRALLYLTGRSHREIQLRLDILMSADC